MHRSLSAKRPFGKPVQIAGVCRHAESRALPAGTNRSRISNNQIHQRRHRAKCEHNSGPHRQSLLAERILRSLDSEQRRVHKSPNLHRTKSSNSWPNANSKRLALVLSNPTHNYKMIHTNTQRKPAQVAQTSVCAPYLWALPNNSQNPQKHPKKTHTD